MNSTFQFVLRTPTETLFQGEVSNIIFASEGEGMLQIFPDHASFTATIAFTPLVIDVRGEKEEFMLRNGLFLFDNVSNTSTLLVLNAEEKSTVSLQTVKEYLDFIDKQLAAGKVLSDFQVKYLEGEKIAVEQQVRELGA